MSVCLMAEELTSDERIQRIAIAHVKKRRVMLRELGITDPAVIERLAHSGRNGLTRILKTNWSSLPTLTLPSQERSTSGAPTRHTTCSEATALTTQITQVLESNPTLLINTLAQLFMQGSIAIPAASESGSAPKKPTPQ